MSKLYRMKSEDGTGSRHAPVVLKEMWDCHPTYFIRLAGRQLWLSAFCLYSRLLIHDRNT